MYRPNLKFVAFPVPEIIGGTQKIWEVPGYAQNSPNFFHGLLFRWTLLLFWPNLKLPVPEIIAIGVLGGVRTPILGKMRPYEIGDGAVGKSVSKFL